MNIFDTHAHYDDEAFNEDRDELLLALPKNDVKCVINQGIDIETSKFSIKLAEKYDYIYAAVGIQPQEAYKEESLTTIEKLANHPKVVAIGEIGLEYHYDVAPRELQIEYFEKQIEIANKLKLPIVVHNREAHADTLTVLKRTPSNASGVIHCFSGSVETAREFLNLGYFLGFDGPITFKNAKTAIDVLAYTPLDRILVETDSPYLTPMPLRGNRNNSMYIKYILEKIAEIKQLSVDEIANITVKNALTLFSKVDSNSKLC